MGKAGKSGSAALQAKTQRVRQTWQLVRRHGTGGGDASLCDRAHRRRQDSFRIRLSSLGRNVSVCRLDHPRPKGYFGADESKSPGRKRQTILRLAMKLRLVAFLGLALGIFGLGPDRSYAADAAGLRKVRMAFTSLSAVMMPPWLAREAGIFNKHGLEVEVIATPTGVEGMNALIAGEVQFLQISGGTTASAALGGADVMIVGTTLDTLVQNLMARPEIEKPEQLRGKSLGITRFGTSIDVGARLALRHFA